MRSESSHSSNRLVAAAAAVALATALAVLSLTAGTARAAASEWSFEPVHSLTGNCAVDHFDEVMDPGCPDPPRPSGRFQFGENASVAIDSYGNEYVAGFPNLGTSGRIDVFDDEGFFVTELLTPGQPRSVAVDSEGNLYVYEQLGYEERGAIRAISRYTPTEYVPSTGDISYSGAPVEIASPPAPSGLSGLAIDVRDKADVSDDRLFAAEQSQVTEFGSKAEGNLPLATIAPPPYPRSASETWVAVDSQRRRLYASFCRHESNECGVAVFDADAPHTLLEEIDGSELPTKRFLSEKGWISLAVDEATGRLFAGDLEATTKVYEFTPDYKYASTLTYGGFIGGNLLQIAVANDVRDPAAGNFRYLFVPITATEGNVYAFQPPAKSSPGVEKPTVTSIGETEATLGGSVDPHGAATEYFVEYISQPEFEASGWEGAGVAGNGTMPASGAKRVSGVAVGLSPGTAYRFRVRAANEVGGNEAQGAFTTYADAPAPGACPNEGLRVGPSTALPDCRVYELVTPPDTGGLPPRGVDFSGELFSTLATSPDGGAVSFVLKGGTLPGMEGNGGINGDQYRSTRGAEGWTTTSLGPSGSFATGARPGSNSPDQGYSFWTAGLAAGPAAIEGRSTAYLRYPDGHLELVGRGSLGTDPRATGKFIATGGAHVVFQTVSIAPSAAIRLEPDAPPTGTAAVYDRTPDEVSHLVSLLPGNVTPSAQEGATYLAASPDGAGIAFEMGVPSRRLYLRKDNTTTYRVGADVDASGGHLALAGISEGGRRVFYMEGGDLLALDTTTGQTIRFTESGDVTPVNVAPDGTRAYFLSPSVLTTEPNPLGAHAQGGGQNLYLSEEGQIRFLGTVTALDVKGEEYPSGTINGLGLWLEAVAAGTIGKVPSRLTPDGSVFLFQSRTALTGSGSGGSPQIYRYDASDNTLRCLSCIPTGVPSGGGASLQGVAIVEFDPAPFTGYGFVQNLRADGRRAFFQSTEALVASDTDNVQDVYEWEENGVGRCTRPDGCIYLISSGRSGRGDYLYGTSSDGNDVFFTSVDQLTASDSEATLSIYDARVDGGYPEATAAPPCEGEGCRPTLSAAPGLAPVTSVHLGRTGNVAGSVCPKGRQKANRHGKGRCVKRKAKHRNHGKQRRDDHRRAHRGSGRGGK